MLNAGAEIRLRIVEAVLPRLTFPDVKRPGELLDALRDVEAWVLGVEETVTGPAAPDLRTVLRDQTRAIEATPPRGEAIPSSPGGDHVTASAQPGKPPQHAVSSDPGPGTPVLSPRRPGDADARASHEQGRAGRPSGRRDALLALLSQCAEKQTPIGTNMDLGRAIGLDSQSQTVTHIRQLLADLEMRGAIRVEKQGKTVAMRRRVWVRQTGAWTPWPESPAPTIAPQRTAKPARGDKPHTTTLRRHASIAPDPQRVHALAADHPAVTDGRTLFPSTVVSPKDAPRVLVSGHNNRKIGKEVQKGPWRGMPIYTLTLEERATCPRTCHHWRTCYGSAMQWSRRHRHGPELVQKLAVELGKLQAEHPGGFVVRLHVLGDFYEQNYVMAWARWMANHPALHVYGYTAHPQSSGIGTMLKAMNGTYSERFRILFSVPPDAAFAPGQATTIRSAEEAAGATICPAETGGTEACATCGLCWNPAATETKRIAFLLHGMTARGKASEEMAPSGAPGPADNAGTATAFEMPPGGRQSTPSRDEVRPPREPERVVASARGEPSSSIPTSPPELPAPRAARPVVRLDRYGAPRGVDPQDQALIATALAEGRVTKVAPAMAHGAVDLMDRLQRTVSAGKGSQ